MAQGARPRLASAVAVFRRLRTKIVVRCRQRRGVKVFKNPHKLQVWPHPVRPCRAIMRCPGMRGRSIRARDAEADLLIPPTITRAGNTGWYRAIRSTSDPCLGRRAIALNAGADDLVGRAHGNWVSLAFAPLAQSWSGSGWANIQRRGGRNRVNSTRGVGGRRQGNHQDRKSWIIAHPPSRQSCAQRWRATPPQSLDRPRWKIRPTSISFFNNRRMERRHPSRRIFFIKPSASASGRRL